MDEIFITTFTSSLQAVGKIAVIAVVAGALTRRNVVTQGHIDGLVSITVKVFLPCLIFSKIVSTFDPGSFPLWWIMPLAAVLLFLMGMGISLPFFAKGFLGSRNMLALACMQNAGYFVLAIGQMIYRDRFDEFAMCCFLFVFGYSPILWSVGKYLSTSHEGSRHSAKGFITPPLCANFLAIIIALAGWRVYVPGMVLDVTGFIGSPTVPLAIFILGATLGGISYKKWPPAFDIARVIIIKFVLIPAAAICIVRLSGLKNTHPLIADLFVIQAASAPATGLILQVRNYGGDLQKVGSMMLLSYGFSIFAIPFWLAVWRIL